MKKSFFLVLASLLITGCPPGNTTGDATPGDASDVSRPSDSGDAAPPSDATNADAATCSHHLAPGFAQVVASPTIPNVLTGNSTTRTLSMALDENDDPMFAYTDRPMPTDDGYTLEFVRWDPCAGAFTAPVQVDTNHAGPPLDVAIGYDVSTHEVAIAYTRADTDNGWADFYQEVWLASMPASAHTFSRQLLSQTHTCCSPNGQGAAWSAQSPSIAMRGGRIYLAYVQQAGAAQDYPLVWYLTSASTYMPPMGPPGVADAGEAQPDSGAGVPVHNFSYQAVPFNGPPPNANAVLSGYAFPRFASGALSLALDSSGAPALAFFEASDNDYRNFRVLYWRPGMTNAVVAYEFGVDGDVDLTLAFSGTTPRIAGHMVGSMASDSLTVLTSHDGTTWNPPVFLANGGTQFDSALAADGMGHEAIAADVNSSNPTCAANPFISLSMDEGMTWTPSCPNTTNDAGYGAYSMNAIYGASRNRGKLMLGFVNSNATGTAPAQMPGIIYYQQP
jgi:hypothetical protein